MRILLTFLLVNYIISVSAQCKLITVTDKSTGTVSISTRYEDAGRFMAYGQIRFGLTMTVKSDTAIRLRIQISQKKTKCISADSKIFISTDSGTVTLKLMAERNSHTQYDTNGSVSGLISCGKDLECFADLGPAEIQLLRKSRMNGIKVYYPGEYYEFQVIHDYRDQYDYFRRSFRCLEHQ